jgi:Fic-DOC domain mobile mystery protein B
VTFLGGDDPPGATPLTDDDRVGLIPTDVATRGDLNDVEAANISVARTWATTRSWTAESLLRDSTLRDLHRRMYEQVWRWAGTYRRRDTNIGVEWATIPVALRDLLDDAQAWVTYATFEPDVLALRFHHRLVQVHAFPNGNGRHARLVTDLLARALDRPAFTWGGADLTDVGAARAAYLNALRAMNADREDVVALLAFARA